MSSAAHARSQPADNAPTLGCRLRDRRKALGLTLAQVADAAGLTAGFISQIERDLATPSLTSLTNVARVLDLDPAAFLMQPPDPGAASAVADAGRALQTGSKRPWRTLPKNEAAPI